MPQADSHHTTAPRARRKALPNALKRQKPLGKVKRHIPDPAGYALQANGDCPAPTVRDGDIVICSPSTKVEVGMIVVFHFKQGGTPKLKRLTILPSPPAHSDDNAIFPIHVEMDNPHREFLVNPELVERMHAVAGVVRDGQYIPIPAVQASRT